MIIGIADVLFWLFAFAGLYFLHLTTRALKIRASFVGIGVGVGNRKLATYVLMSLLCAGLSYGLRTARYEVGLRSRGHLWSRCSGPKRPNARVYCIRT